MHGTVYLVASGEGAVLKTVAGRAMAGITGDRNPRSPSPTPPSRATAAA